MLPQSIQTHPEDILCLDWPQLSNPHRLSAVWKNISTNLAQLLNDASLQDTAMRQPNNVLSLQM